MRLAICSFVFLALALAAGASQPAALTIDYPADRTIFPPDLAPPTFLFRDAAPGNAAWRVNVAFTSGAAPITLDIQAEWNRVGEIDYRAISETNELPRLTPQQAAARAWTPDAAAWEAIKKGSSGAPATLTIIGLQSGAATSQGSITLTTAKDPVGAPVFFRDVPLMPAELEKGIIKPLPKAAIPLIAWRLRYVHETQSRTLVTGLPTCANCHSFSKDGKTLGMDLDGPQNDKGLYALVPINRDTVIRNQDVVAWSSFKGKLGGALRVGFMSQVSPDSRFVVTMVNPSELGIEDRGKDVKGNFYVQNFTQYRFLQVFYPTRGVLAWYSRETGRLQPLPGADDPRYVHANATWSPDGKYLIFARAASRDPYTPGATPAARANDPNETQIQYDLYRIPFNDGKGGTPEPIPGASANGMSNSFPKISPDGRWLVWVQAKNGLLMRPDGKLFIASLAGGKPRQMTCNTPLMNSWHSFSPNGRWMVFSSKSRSPYTQMYLTHIDENGNDSPPVLVENATAANRAVNIPEFVNVAPDAWASIQAPATEFYRISDNALELMQAAKLDESIAEWQKALAMEPDDVSALSNYGSALSVAGRTEDAMAQFEKAVKLNPDNYRTLSNYGAALARAGRFDDAAKRLERAHEINPDDAATWNVLGAVLLRLGNLERAETLLRKAVEANPADSNAQNNLGGVLAKAGRFAEAVPHFEKALAAEPDSIQTHDNLGRALRELGKTDLAERHLRRAAELRGQK